MDPFHESLFSAITAGQPIIWIVADDEIEVLEFLNTLQTGKRRFSVWTHRYGVKSLQDHLSGEMQPNSMAITTALQKFFSYKTPGHLIIPDGHLRLASKFDNMLRELKDAVIAEGGTDKGFLIISPTDEVPMEIQSLTYVVHFPKPKMDDLTTEVRYAYNNSWQTEKLSDESVRSIAFALSGLTKTEARLLCQRLFQADVTTSLEFSIAKARHFGSTSLIQWVPADVTPGNIGGLDRLKKWIEVRSMALSPDSDLPRPKGIVLCGPPGVGKSMTAKATASAWGLPLMRFDISRIYSSLIGSSEANMRRAVSIIDAASPCVVWIDEFEKALSGIMSSDRSDGGTAARVVGTFLTWLQERTSSAFVVATVNGVERMGPETIRRGRWDEVFWIDLPSRRDRRQIWEVLLRKYKVELKISDEVVEETRGFSGAEIEQAILNAIFNSKWESSPVTNEQLLHAVGEIVPQCNSLSIDWNEMRERFTPASSGKFLRMDPGPGWGTKSMRTTE